MHVPAWRRKLGLRVYNQASGKATIITMAGDTSNTSVDPEGPSTPGNGLNTIACYWSVNPMNPRSVKRRPCIRLPCGRTMAKLTALARPCGTSTECFFVAAMRHIAIAGARLTCIQYGMIKASLLFNIISKSANIVAGPTRALPNGGTEIRSTLRKLHKL